MKSHSVEVTGYNCVMFSADLLGHDTVDDEEEEELLDEEDVEKEGKEEEENGIGRNRTE